MPFFSGRVDRQVYYYLRHGVYNVYMVSLLQAEIIIVPEFTGVGMVFVYFMEYLDSYGMDDVLNLFA